MRFCLILAKISSFDKSNHRIADLTEKDQNKISDSLLNPAYRIYYLQYFGSFVVSLRGRLKSLLTLSVDEMLSEGEAGGSGIKSNSFRLH